MLMVRGNILYLEGDVMTIIAGMDDNVDDEDLKEEIMRCFSNAPTKFKLLEC